MDSLDGTEWDVVIAGTGVTESLLALSLSRSGKRILHLDTNDYYGGDEAALSLSEAEAWAERYSAEDTNGSFSHAAVYKAEADGKSEQPKLGSSRAYSLALAPHLIYSRSNLISTVVSARIHNQLEFQAVGSWFVLDGDGSSLLKVPGGREDVFADTALDLKSKRSLMKFLRFVADYEENGGVWEDERDTPFPDFLEKKFGLPSASLGPILALTMSTSPPGETPTELALSRIARHARSIGAFGPGFGAVLPKWGGLAEIAQVACRACAVGGGVYVLGKKIENIARQEDEYPISLQLSDGDDKISTKWLVSSDRSIHANEGRAPAYASSTMCKSISVVSAPLAALFPPTSEGGVLPAGSVIVVPSSNPGEPPVHIFAHTSEAGECPTGQCVLYASVALQPEQGFSRLEDSVAALLSNLEGDSRPTVLWSLRYQQTYSAPQDPWTENGVVLLPSMSSSLALEDEILNNVKRAWREITGEDEEKFIKFEAREGIGEDED